MKMTILLKKFRNEKKEFVTSEELKKYCKPLGFDYESLVRYFERRGYLIRIFRGIFYVRFPEDIESGKLGYTHLELVAWGLKLKGVKDWYFGLHTALKLNNLTHEHFVIDEVINDKIFRSKPMNINGYKFKFFKISKPLLNFGIEEKNEIKFSNPEKTILDFIYIWKSNGIPSEKIIHDISEWSKHTSKNKIMKYSESYPKSIQKIVEMIH